MVLHVLHKKAMDAAADKHFIRIQTRVRHAEGQQEYPELEVPSNSGCSMVLSHKKCAEMKGR